MQRSVPLFLALVLLMACDSNEGVLLGPAGTYEIAANVPDADLMVPYQAALTIPRYEGPAEWALASGELPPGLGLQSNGAISGTPTWVGQFDFTVQVTGMNEGASLQGELDIEVRIGDADVALGWARDQITSLTDSEGLMWDMWVRIRGAGVEMSTYVVNPGIYLTGPNGMHEAGRNDDVRVGDLTVDDVEITTGAWQEINMPNGDPPHTAEGSGIEYLGNLDFKAGADTGEMTVTLASDYGTEQTRIYAVPPDWCAQGVDGFDGWCE